ncbi:hypothetical protein ACLK19_15735 [Escherichia coli]
MSGSGKRLMTTGVGFGVAIPAYQISVDSSFQYQHCPAAKPIVGSSKWW